MAKRGVSGDIFVKNGDYNSVFCEFVGVLVMEGFRVVLRGFDCR